MEISERARLKLYAFVYSGGDSIEYIAATSEEQAIAHAVGGWETVSEADSVRCGACNALWPFDEDWEHEEAPKLSRALIAAAVTHDCDGGRTADSEHVLKSGGDMYLFRLRSTE